jgi:polar amino acid transport system substrate-binding protein
MQYAEGTQVTPGSSRIATASSPINKDKLGLSFFGAGNYATASLLPPLSDDSTFQFRGLVTASGRTAQGVAKQFGFSFCAGEFSEILESDTDAIMVTTRHDTHAQAVVDALKAKKHIYVEKPIALNVEEMQAIHTAKVGTAETQVMVGFNRRFAPSTQDVINHFKAVKSPLVVNIRVNSGEIPADHWIQDVKTGGGRVIGEGCHFVDLASALVGSNPKTVNAIGTAKANKSAMLNDNVIISLTFDNGSIANIVYTADGAKAMQKEYVEVFGGGRSATINDFKEAILYQGDSKQEVKKQAAQDKGQKAMLKAWAAGLKSGTPCVAYECLMANSLATILAVESLALGSSLSVDLDILSTTAE